MMSGPIADIHSNAPQHLAVASPPTIKSLLVPDTGADLCALAHSQPLCLYHTPTSLWQTGLISPTATLHPASKRTAVEKAPQGPLRMDSWIKHVPKASFLSPRSAQALIRHGSRELPTVTSPSFSEQKGTVLRSCSSEGGLPPTQSLRITSTHSERGQQRKIEMREGKKNEAWKIKLTKRKRKRNTIFLGARCNTWVKSTVYTDPFKHHQSSLARRSVIYVTVCQRKLGSPARCVVKHDGAGQCTNSGGLVPCTPASLCFTVP